MDLLEIETWLDHIIRQEKSNEKIKNDTILKEINRYSHSFLDRINQRHEAPFDDIFDMFNHYQVAGGGYREQTIVGYFYSWTHSSEILSSNNLEYTLQVLIEWWDDLLRVIGDTEKCFRYVLNIYLFHLKERGMTLKKDIPLNLYEWSRKMFYNEISEFIEGHYELKRLSKGKLTIKDLEPGIAKSLLDNLNWLDKRVDLEKVFPNGEDWRRADIGEIKLDLENIEKELNRRNAGPKEKNINVDLSEKVQICIIEEQMTLSETGLYKFITAKNKIKHSTIGDYLNEKYELNYSYKGIAEKIKDILPGITIVEKKGNQFYKKRK